MPAAIITAFTASILMGLIYGIATIGFSLGYRHMKFPDFTTLSAIMVGGVTCIVVTNQTELWIIGLLSGILVGGLLGLCTGLQITFLKIPATLAGITTSVAAFTLAFEITRNNADVALNQDSPGIFLNFIASNVFSWSGGVIGFLELIVVAFVVSRIFATRYGDYVLALQGTENYINHRHPCVDGTKIGLLIFSNAIIGMSGALAAFQNRTAGVENHKEFLMLALAGYSLGAKIIIEINKLSKLNSIKCGGTFLSDQGVPLLTPLYKWFVTLATINDEEPTKIYISLCTYACSTVIINLIFKYFEIEFGNNDSYFFKAMTLLLVLAFASYPKQVSYQELP